MEEKLPWTQRVRLFQKGVVALTIVFFLLMILTVMIAFARRSGSTGMDPAKIQMDRTKFHQHKNVLEPQAINRHYRKITPMFWSAKACLRLHRSRACPASCLPASRQTQLNRASPVLRFCRLTDKNKAKASLRTPKYYYYFWL